MARNTIKKNKGKIWNLSPEQWSEVLDTGSSVEKTICDIREGRVLPWVKTLLSYTRKDESVLDLGSGAGQNSAILALNGRKTTLLDFSPENIDFSQKLFDALDVQGEFFRADMTRPLEFADSSFDTVFSCGVFEYFTDTQIVEILREALRVSKKQVIIMVPNAASAPYRLGMWYKQLTNKWQWGGERPFYSLISYCKKAGAGNITEYSVGFKHALKFLTMPLGRVIQKLLILIFHLDDHARRSFLNQGYLLVTIAKKA
jgi:ubiquinone/menaquinone biosynthesis C-methylase UbiE